MKKEDLRIVYMGTPDFAVEPLKQLVEHGFRVVGVITMPDKPMGRHQNTLQPSAVKQYAVSQGLRVLQPEKLKDETFVEELRSLQADLQIVVAFRMLPQVVWQMPRLGTFNLHASLLPRYRGAAPINWAIINGDKETGITTFFLKHEIDTGEVIQQVRIPIEETDNVEDVHDKLMYKGGELVLETVENILNDNVHPIPQEEMMQGEEPLLPAPKIFKETCRINWNQTTKRVYDFVRGLSPYPAAWTEMQNAAGTVTGMKIYQTALPQSFTSQEAASGIVPGTIVTDGKNEFKVATQDGWVVLQELQLNGKKRMKVADFLRGLHHAEDLKMI